MTNERRPLWVPVRGWVKQWTPGIVREAVRAARWAKWRREQLRRLRGPPAHPPGRLVSYLAHRGLANRMRAHYVAQDFALRTGRTLAANWPRTDECHATLTDLFEWDGPSSFPANARTIVVRYDPEEDLAWPGLDGDPRADAVVLDAPWQNIKRLPFKRRFGDRLDAARRFLVPRPDIQAEADAFDRDWPPAVIGVHIRRGDFVTVAQQALPTYRYVRAIAAALADAPPGCALFLASDGTDDELAPVLHEVRAPILPRRPPGPRHTTDGVRGALVDMLLLARTRQIVLTPSSSFGEMATFLGNVPFLYA